MKKLLAAAALLFSAYTSSGQCVPDSSITHNDPGVYPDSATGLPHAVVGVAYSTNIQFNVLTDTVYLGQNVQIDDFEITSVDGLPTGFTYLCTPSDCIFPSGTNSCILLQGPAPTMAMIGSYPLVVNYTVHGNLSGIPASLPLTEEDYSIVIDSTTGIGGIDRLIFSSGQNTPNPAKAFTVIPVTLSKPGDVTMTVSNLIGKNVITKNLTLPRGKSNVTVDLHDLQAGIYLYTFSNGNDKMTRRMIISND